MRLRRCRARVYVMKKRLFALLLAISILVSMVVIPTYAEGAETQNITAVTEVCSCGCGKTLNEITWTPWVAKPGSGHYYLTGDYVMELFGIEPCNTIGQLKEQVKNAILDGVIENSFEAADAFMRERAAEIGMFPVK